ncbi:MAG: GNAT family N-acetyltransferase [Gemmatimonadota bacterium]
MTSVRLAVQSDLDQLAIVWHDAWQDGHAGLLPAELTRHRTLPSFRERLNGYFAELRVVGPVGAPLGFYTLQGDELYQLFVSAEARGTGVAAALIADAEARLTERGVTTAWLSCAIGNQRAARFYEKCEWHLVGVVVENAATPEGPVALEVWRYEKQLGR